MDWVVAMVSQRPTLRVGHRVAAFLYAGTGVVSLVLGTIYLLRPTFMPYHSVALSKDWSALDIPTRVLVKGLMEVAWTSPDAPTVWLALFWSES
jgi:hypothetical protein